MINGTDLTWQRYQERPLEGGHATAYAMACEDGNTYRMKGTYRSEEGFGVSWFFNGRYMGFISGGQLGSKETQRYIYNPDSYKEIEEHV